MKKLTSDLKKQAMEYLQVRDRDLTDEGIREELKVISQINVEAAYNEFLATRDEFVAEYDKECATSLALAAERLKDCFPEASNFCTEALTKSNKLVEMHKAVSNITEYEALLNESIAYYKWAINGMRELFELPTFDFDAAA